MVELYKKVQTALMQSAALGFLGAIVGTYGYRYSQTPTANVSMIMSFALLIAIVIGALLAQNLRELRAQLS